MMTSLNRREFLKLSALMVGGAALRPLLRKAAPQTFPETPRLGRVAVGKTNLYASPDADSSIVGALYEDNVVPWLKEITGYNRYRYSQRFLETPDGYAWSPDLQPVRNNPNSPQTTLPESSLGKGMWVEVTVPYVDLTLDNPPARAPWLQSRLEYGFPPPRFYFSQILWADDVKTEGGQVYYRLNERFGFGDIVWAPAEAFRPITPEEIAPINPEAEQKTVLVDVSRQTLQCFEGDREVYYCRVSTGAKFDAAGNAVEKWATPLGEHRTWRKMISTHMVGGTTGGGYDLPGIGWTVLFVGTGVAVHSTFWHNEFGTPRSHGCVNAAPEDARWVFRWTQPEVAWDPGDVTVSMPGGTVIKVIES